MSKTTPKPVKLSITNIYGGGDYTAEIQVGSNGDTANVTLDTGSSTLAVKTTAYNAAADTDIRATSLAQDVLYGSGAWAGPLVHTTVAFALTEGTVSIKNTPIAITEDEQEGNFGNADGIMGLAYSALNEAFEIKAMLEQRKINPPVTYPWPFHVADTHEAIEKFQSELHESGTIQPVTPYFTQLEEQGIVLNKFAFYTLRSFPYIGEGVTTVEEVLQEPLNQGFLILGGGEEETDLYTGEFTNVKVVDDVYYNINIIAAQLGEQPEVKGLPLQEAYVADYVTNGIVDSGTNALTLDFQVYQGLIKSFSDINPDFVTQIHLSGHTAEGILTSELNLSEWPTLYFMVEGAEGETVKLAVSPDTYWQTNVSPGRSLFNIHGHPQFEEGVSLPNQSILGLTLMNNYYTIFDRSVGEKGVIKFATIKK